MTNKVFPGGRGQKKPHKHTTVRIPRQLASVVKYMGNAYGWQLPEGIPMQAMHTWCEHLNKRIYDLIDERLDQIQQDPNQTE